MRRRLVIRLADAAEREFCVPGLRGIGNGHVVMFAIYSRVGGLAHARGRS
jgi:hypothetical protein